MKEIMLPVTGVYHFVDSDSTVSIFTCQEANNYGIYLWSIEYKNEYLIYYVGETGTSFKQRFSEHTKEYLSGYYGINNIHDFKNGKLNREWNGLWRDKENKFVKYNEFLLQYNKYSSNIINYLKLFRIFLIPMTEKTTIRKQLENRITVDLLNHDDTLISKFLEPDTYSYTPRKDKKVKIKLRINHKIKGLMHEYEI